MASNNPNPKKDAPLSFMQSLSPAVSYFEPPKHQSSTSSSNSTSSTSSSSRDPELILFFSWMGARDAHIAKYIVRHRALFPSSRMLLVRCPLGHIYWPPAARKDTALAIPFVKEMIDRELAEQSGAEIDNPAGEKEKRPVKVLIHAFSNGGLSTAMRLYAMLKAEYNNTLTLPRHVLILDCCPGYFRYRNTHAALLQTLPWWTNPFIHLALLFTRLAFTLFRQPPAQNRIASAAVSLSLIPSEARRTYTYGSADEMVDWRDVEHHASRAVKAGFAVRTERFEGARHVACARADGERYWRVVSETWEGTESQQ